MKQCIVAGCDHYPGYQSAGDTVDDYCECHFFDDVPEDACEGRPTSPGSEDGPDEAD